MITMNSELIILREAIEHIDHQILKSMAKRMEIIKVLAETKQKNGQHIIDEKREEYLMRLWRYTAQQYGLDPDSMCKILHILLKMSKDVQRSTQE
jgi:chorismate mutase